MLYQRRLLFFLVWGIEIMAAASVTAHKNQRTISFPIAFFSRFASK